MNSIRYCFSFWQNTNRTLSSARFSVIYFKGKQKNGNKKKNMTEDKSKFGGLSCKQAICSITQHFGSSCCLPSLCVFSFKIRTAFSFLSFSGSLWLSRPGIGKYRALGHDNIAADHQQLWINFLFLFLSLPIFPAPPTRETDLLLLLSNRGSNTRP